MKEHKRLYDVHCHILPGVDDGAKDMETALQMLRYAYEEGIKTIILTPHEELTTTRTAEKELEVFDQLCDEAAKISPEIELYLGKEIYYQPGMVERIKEKQTITLAGSRYVLAEFSVSAAYREIQEGLHELIVGGYAPILAHVERYQCLRDVQRVGELVDAGVYIQVNADSIIGGFWDSTARYCSKLFKQGYVSFIGTDAHNMTNRKPAMREAIKKLEKMLPEPKINQILYENPAMVLKNKYI